MKIFRLITLIGGEISENRINPRLFKENPKSAREIYRQIKHALDKHSDHINANWFYALEMKAYEKYLKTLSWKDHFQEKLVFYIHNFISNFGQSWLRPFVLIITSTLLMLGLGLRIDTKENFIYGLEHQVGNYYLITPLLNIEFWVFYLALATFGFYYYLYLTFKKNGINLEKNHIGYLDNGFWTGNIKINLFLAVAIIFFVFLTIYMIGLFWFHSGKSLIASVFEFLDRFATTLNIFKVFSNFAGEDSSLYKLYSGYLFLYKIYGIFILVLIYQLILAIRRRVKR